MDPLTQGVLGASLPQSTGRAREAAGAGLLGFFAGMAADLDVLIRSSTDPLLFLEYHRQFTHALVFIPVGGLLCALVLHGLIGRHRGFSFARSAMFCTLGYATHALLDACTTYGTMLFWPFSDARVAWNTVSIIDPLFTVPVLALVLLAGLRRRPALARCALAWALGYLLLGQWQHHQAVELGRELAAARGHAPLRLEAKPSFGNILLWKVVYETGDRFYVDAVRSGPWPAVYPGDSVARLDAARDLPWLDRDSQQARDVQRFRWFSNGYVARDPRYPNRVIDIRYSLLPNEIAPLWSIELDPAAGARVHANYITHRDGAGNSAGALWAMLTGPASSAGEYRLGGG
ncbi:metal-dependent hydrolase [Parahaliea mediterranea]|uniref:Metal-dependent hydrolase n=1 Tax=Parahaliea mediterranea TaxID=651086 RepID=A0A939DIJ3_9GAMM|nr:metal-dependent hydrolase [Parahaliea mediterranea]MBN7798643.1 metal-dependent hydrolase [Parahaliea mediterranea]